MKKTNRILTALMILVMLFALISCQRTDPWESAKYTEDTSLGEGANEFTLIVEVGEHEVSFDIKTDKLIVGDALLELSLIDGDEGDYGLYVKYVNGIKADYDKDKHYWAFYVGESYAALGVDMTEIVTGETYKLVYSK